MPPVTGRIQGEATTWVEVSVAKAENGGVWLRCADHEPLWLAPGDSVSLTLKVPFDTEVG